MIRVRVIYFNITGNNGQVLSISAQNNQYFSANNIIVNQEYRWKILEYHKLM